MLTAAGNVKALGTLIIVIHELVSWYDFFYSAYPD
jgi:hypothetical protein